MANTEILLLLQMSIPGGYMHGGKCDSPESTRIPILGPSLLVTTGAVSPSALI